MNIDAKAPRGRRRMQRERMIGRAQRYAKAWGLSPQHYLKCVDNLAICSGPCCGNQRRWTGPGLREKALRQAMDAEIREMAL